MDDVPTTDGDTVQLVVPALPQYARVARVTGAVVARRLGFSYRRRADLRLAIDEMMILLLGAAHEGTLTLDYLLSGGDIAVEATSNFSVQRPDDDAEALARFERIVGDLVDAFEVEDRSRVVLKMVGD